MIRKTYLKNHITRPAAHKREGGSSFENHFRDPKRIISFGKNHENDPNSDIKTAPPLTLCAAGRVTYFPEEFEAHIPPVG